MSTITIHPHNLTGIVQVPSSKSMGHRAIICSALAGDGEITHLTPSQDITATQRVLEALLGTDAEALCPCGESGSTLRFLLPLAWALGRRATFTGEGKLGSRPLDIYFQLMDKQGIKYTKPSTGNLPLKVEGQLQAGAFQLPGDVSSQFVSGLLFALPLLEASSTLELTGKVESGSYIEMTLEVLEQFGISIERLGPTSFSIPGAQHYQPRAYAVEGDYSASAFWLVAGTLGGPIQLTNMAERSLQGDRVGVELLQAMGGKVVREGSTLLVTPAQTQGIEIDAADCPDIIPVFATLAAVSTGATRIYNAGRLRIKECDRLRATATELNKLGARVQELPDGLLIEGVPELKGGAVSAWNDHRMAMSMAIAALRCTAPVIIDNRECVAKSYPAFWQDYAQLGGRYE